MQFCNTPSLLFSSSPLPISLSPPRRRRPRRPCRLRPPRHRRRNRANIRRPGNKVTPRPGDRTPRNTHRPRPGPADGRRPLECGIRTIKYQPLVAQPKIKVLSLTIYRKTHPLQTSCKANKHWERPPLFRPHHFRHEYGGFHVKGKTLSSQK